MNLKDTGLSEVTYPTGISNIHMRDVSLDTIRELNKITLLNEQFDFLLEHVICDPEGNRFENTSADFGNLAKRKVASVVGEMLDPKGSAETSD